MPHSWLLTFDNIVIDQLRHLPLRDRMAVFRAIAELLKADNPVSVPGVKKLVEKRFEGLWRQRQGNHRIFFRIIPGEFTEFQHLYKGKLHLVAVLPRSRAY